MWFFCQCCTTEDDEVHIIYPFHSVIWEESSRYTLSSQNVTLALNKKQFSEGSDALPYLECMSPLSPITIKLQQYVALMNKCTQLFLHSHSVKSSKIKRAYEVSLISRQVDPEYEKWIIRGEKTSTSLSSGDVVTIQHKLTRKMLGAVMNNFSNNYDICCVSDESEATRWKVEILRDGHIRLMHLQSCAYLIPFARTATIKTQFKAALSHTKDPQTVWVVVHYEL